MEKLPTPQSRHQHCAGCGLEQEATTLLQVRLQWYSCRWRSCPPRSPAPAPVLLWPGTRSCHLQSWAPALAAAAQAKPPAHHPLRLQPAWAPMADQREGSPDPGCLWSAGGGNPGYQSRSPQKREATRRSGEGNAPSYLCYCHCRQHKPQDERKEYISRQLHLYKSQSNSILKFMKGSTNLTSASLSIAHSIAQHGKVLSEGEFIKETLLRCAPVLFHDMQNKDSIIKRISELPLSRNIIKDRIMRLNTNVQHQLKRDIKELIKLVSVSTSKSGSEICKVVIQTFRDLSIDISKVVSVTTDGAPNMVGEKVGFAKLFTEAIGHAIREFSALLLEVDSTYSGLLIYNNVRWLSRGKILECFVECFEEIKVFLDDKDLGNFPQLNDDKWVNTLMFFTDLSVHINELNLKLQGFGKSINVMFGYIKAFESKVKIFKRDVETKTLTKYFEKASAAVQNEMELLHMKYQHVLDSLLEQFSDRFSQFRSLELTMKIIKYPDVVVHSSVELNGFQWMQIDDLEMQLAEFQDSIWARVFVDLRSKLENLERCRLENQEECHYEQEIRSAWNRLPDTFSTLKNRAMALLTFFPLHTFALFSALNNIKTNKRNRLTDEVSSTCLGLKCTKYQPSIEDLANEIQQQKTSGKMLVLGPPQGPGPQRPAVRVLGGLGFQVWLPHLAW
ncbi:LOW QUALITY PROTEIN: hypothetical protein QTO34_007914 [Cnephaeus nilssonii]|uniref:DUF4371 domain-containing protein n=1 Tax=Cnephaeus nilssonii TaxID=3371016 RepID=A0AA40I9D0_CNENI|nr:LOW QUALITY PROTEIN: hypothetical protein QTO34_007914 [Eptesicus nilssonii]